MQRLLFVLLLWWGQAQAAEALVAVAAGFKPAMEPILQRFSAETGHQITVSYGAVGQLYAQIKNGAPFDLLLSADSLVPAKLADDGLGVADSRLTYARSELVLYSTDPSLVDKEGAVLKTGHFAHLALPNPKVAVHGTAAMAVLAKLGLAEQLAPKLVEGGNILQTFQQIQTGNAELGFVSLSLIYNQGHYAPGSYWRVPASLHAPLEQQAILLSRGADNAAAQDLLHYLQTPAARAIMQEHGYLI
ncbi:molybdate ABC transporter substrate-binding protein [Pseudaeromonas sp. ZJS20]|uniref:molybdate ABC transporter substrate-binding protein n=1 Tax=Pseudaeromonas aegiceratis TaxID=3153928 RepID=UPI00390C5A5D